MKFNHRDITDMVERPSISNTVIGLFNEDEEQVSVLGLREYRMRFGSAQLKLGGICAVGTKDEHRNKGYSRRVMEHAAEFMIENGFNVAMRFGIPNFYHKFGYSIMLPETRVEFDTKFGMVPAPFGVLNEAGEVIGYFVCDVVDVIRNMIYFIKLALMDRG